MTVDNRPNSQIIYRVAFLAALIYIVTGPFRGISPVGIVPNLALIIATTIVSIYVIIHRNLTASKYTLLVGFLLILLILNHIIMNNFYELTIWSMSDIVMNFFILIPLFWLPVLLIGTDKCGSWRANILLHGHLLATIIVSILVFLIGVKIISDPLDMVFGNRLGLSIERTTYPIRSTSIFSIYMVPATIFAFGRMLGNKYNQLYFVLFGLLVVTSIMSAFRKVWIGTLCGIIVYMLFKKDTRRMTYKSLLLASPVLSLALYLMYYIAPNSTMYRVKAWISTVEFIINNPMGVGHTGVRQIVGYSAHNIFLNAFGQYGVGAFVLLLAICVISVLQAIRVGMRSSSIVTMSLAASVIALLVGLQFENSYILHRFWLFVGLLWATTDIDLENQYK